MTHICRRAGHKCLLHANKLHSKRHVEGNPGSTADERDADMGRFSSLHPARLLSPLPLGPQGLHFGDLTMLGWGGRDGRQYSLIYKASSCPVVKQGAFSPWYRKLWLYVGAGCVLRWALQPIDLRCTLHMTETPTPSRKDRKPTFSPSSPLSSRTQCYLLP